MEFENVNIDLFFLDICLSKAINDLDIFYKISEEDRYILKEFVINEDVISTQKKIEELTKFTNPRLFGCVGALFNLFHSYKNFPEKQ